MLRTRSPRLEGYFLQVDGVPYRTIWLSSDEASVCVIDQTRLPHAFEIQELKNVEDAERAIKTMVVRGAPLIGVTAAYGMALAMQTNASDANLQEAARFLIASRPTAVNLKWAVGEMLALLTNLPASARRDEAFEKASSMCEDDVASSAAIGANGLTRLAQLVPKDRPLNILTHCNAGWLAAVDWGTALAPIYAAFNAKIDVHVWVDETRPRNQGASLTAWELGQHGVPHTLICDNAGGYLMREGKVDACIVGSDRLASNGDVCNKIGTYLKALAAFDNNVPFYAALPHSTIDWQMASGDAIPIEERDGDEISWIQGLLRNGSFGSVRITPQGTPIANPAFDVTPARLITEIITETGVCAASTEALAALYPNRGLS